MITLPGQRTWGVAAIIVLGGCFIGLLVNLTLVCGTPASPAGRSDSAARVYPVPVTLAEVRALAAEQAVLLDARPRPLFLAGHLPGARSVPYEEVVGGGLTLEDRLPHDRPLVIYCSGNGCSDSFSLAEALIRSGYRDVRVFEDGFPAWRAAGLPVVAGER